jgi:hypothetical protein
VDVLQRDIPHVGGLAGWFDWAADGSLAVGFLLGEVQLARCLQALEDGCGEATQVNQTHASNHPATATVTETHSKQSKVRRVGKKSESNDSTAQQHTQHTARRRFRWVVVGSGDGLLNPEPLVLADQERITPNVPTDGRGRGPRSYQATKILSLRSHQYHRAGFCCQALCCPSCTPPKRQRRREGYGQQERSASECTSANLGSPTLKLTYAGHHEWPRP